MPHVPPEKRPSVMRPTDSPRPWPISADVGASISCMPGAAFRPFVADHDDVAGLDLLRHDRVHACVLGVEHARRAGNRRILEAGDLGDAAFGARGCRAGSRDGPARTSACRPGTDDVLVRARLRRARPASSRPMRPAGDRHAVAVQQRRASSSIFSTCGTPPARWKSTAT